MNRNDPTADQLYGIAQELAVSGRYAEAIDAYSSVFDSDPAHINARCGRGLSLQRIGEHIKAIADFDEVISFFTDWPGVFVAYYGRAASRQVLGRNVEAIEDCDEAIARNPEFIDALYLRGTVRKALGQIEEAVSDMNAVVDADPGYHEAYCVRGSLHYLQQRWQQAIDDFTAAIEQNKNQPEGSRQCIYLRGMAAQELGDHLAAIVDFAQVIEMLPDDAGAYLRRSRSYAELGEVALADVDFKLGSRLIQR
jgi:tetratricopeptide (TPR) repeat protein